VGDQLVQEASRLALWMAFSLSLVNLSLQMAGRFIVDVVLVINFVEVGWDGY
jgi:hypothetical protein